MKVKPAKGDFDAGNEIIAFKAASGELPKATTGEKTTSTKPAWGKTA